MHILDGKAIGQQIRAEIKKEISQLVDEGKRVPGLAVVRMNEDQASGRYVSSIMKNAERVGIKPLKVELSVEESEAALLQALEDLNQDPKIDGIILQMPLPKHIDVEKAKNTIAFNKDVEGITLVNAAKLYTGQSGFVPCTPLAVIEILKQSNIPMEGQHAVVIGRSNVVGKPCAMLLLQENCSVTICHSHSKNQAELAAQADILVSAVGRAKMINASYTNPQQVVIDVAINTDEEGKLCGDVDFEAVKDKVRAITPVPGGVGSVTNALLLRACLEAYRKSSGA